MQSGIAYLPSLTRHVAEQAAESKIVQDQLANPHTNVFTGEPFGEEQGESGFDMESLVSVDEDALKDLFSFDEGALTDGLSGSFDMGSMDMSGIDMGSVDLSGMIDPNSLQLDIPEFPQMNMADLMKGVKFNVSQESITSLVTGLVGGWNDYMAAHPEADYTGMGDSFLAFLKTEEGGKILSENLQEILDANGITAPTQEQISELITQVVSGFVDYCEKNYHDELLDPNLTDEQRQALLQTYLAEYLGTPEAQAIITQWLSQTFPNAEDWTITQEQLNKLATDLADGYQAYAVAQGLPDPSKMGAYFADYMGTEQAQTLLTGSIASMVDASGLQEQLASTMTGYMQTLMGSVAQSLGSSIQTAMASVMEQVMQQIADNIQTAMEGVVQKLGENLADAFQFDPEDFAAAFTMNMDAEDLSELLQSMSFSQGATYESNLSSLDYVDFADPSTISIYPLDFESKEQVTDLLTGYNDRMTAEGKTDQVITYTDTVGTLMSSVTDIIDIISYVLIAFVAISLVVSSIMIGVITYISVLERKKEIGILRAIGASKQNVSQVFNAETFIIGLAAGLIGIGLTLIILVPGNALIHHLANSNDVNAVLPVGGAVILIALSVLLTLLGGLIPASKAAKSDPVTALRTE